MISYAPIGGSVGPHFDQYDVFLLQASGERLWQIGQHCKDSDKHLASDVKVLADFEESERHLLKPGDMLYLPPGVAHHGVSQSDDCMTISIGFRAPSTLEVLDRLVVNLSEELTSGDRYKDPELRLNHPNQIDEQSLTQLQKLIENAITQPELIAKTFGELMTEKRHTNESLDLDEGNTYFVKALDARLAFIEQAEGIILFANGQSLSVDKTLHDFILWVCDCVEVDLSQLNEIERPIATWLVEHGVFIQIEEG
jgi:50S ribosomal protein L16 3-hydroxylase